MQLGGGGGDGVECITVNILVLLPVLNCMLELRSLKQNIGYWILK